MSNSIDPLFGSHRLNEAGIKTVQTIKETFTSMLAYLTSVCATSRELSIVKTKLEGACLFAVKAAANRTENQSE